MGQTPLTRRSQKIARNRSEWTGDGRGSDHGGGPMRRDLRRDPPAFRTPDPNRTPTDSGRARRTPRKIAFRRPVAADNDWSKPKAPAHAAAYRGCFLRRVWLRACVPRAARRRSLLLCQSVRPRNQQTNNANNVPRCRRRRWSGGGLKSSLRGVYSARRWRPGSTVRRDRRVTLRFRAR